MYRTWSGCIVLSLHSPTLTVITPLNSFRDTKQRWRCLPCFITEYGISPCSGRIYVVSLTAVESRDRGEQKEGRRKGRERIPFSFCFMLSSAGIGNLGRTQNYKCTFGVRGWGMRYLNEGPHKHRNTYVFRFFSGGFQNGVFIIPPIRG